jgi:hypothetical protein
MTLHNSEASSLFATYHEYRISLMESSRLCAYLNLVKIRLHALRQDRCGCLLGGWNAVG